MVVISDMLQVKREGSQNTITISEVEPFGVCYFYHVACATALLVLKLTLPEPV